jgi:hypothetical protein
MQQRVLEGADRALAILAHASIGFGLLGIGFTLGIAINIIIWLRSKRSSYLALQAEQAGMYQLFILLANIGLAAFWLAMLVYVFMGDSTLGPGQLSLRQIAAGLWLALIPGFGIWYLVTIGYGMYGALQISRGRQFWYPVIGAWVRRRAGWERA